MCCKTDFIRNFFLSISNTNKFLVQVVLQGPAKGYLTHSLTVVICNVSQLFVSMFQMQEGISRDVAQLTAGHTNAHDAV